MTSATLSHPEQGATQSSARGALAASLSPSPSSSGKRSAARGSFFAPALGSAERKKDPRLKAEDDALNHQKLAGSPAERNLLISGDQLLPTISSNVSVYPTEPAADPLGEWLLSLAVLKKRVPQDVLVLPAHGRPFRGAYERLDELMTGHRSSLDQLVEFCRQPRRAIDTFPVLFKRDIDRNNLIMATGESIAHLNYLLSRGVLQVETDRHGVRWYCNS